jgi:hypothetical protein
MDEGSPVCLNDSRCPKHSHRAVATVSECEACFTPDVCQLRGTCDHYRAELLRIAARKPERTVADIPDAELLRRVVRTVTRNRPRRQEFAWAAVHDAFGLGSTYAAQLCRRFGIDPDSGADMTPTNTSNRPGKDTP